MKVPFSLAASAVVALSFLSGAWLQRDPAEEDRQRSDGARLLRDIISHVAAYYVDSLTQDQLYEMAINGMLGELGDPYTNYLGEEAFGELRLSTTGNYGGLGIQIMSSDGWITVVTPLADTPADRAGMLPGDQIIAVDGRSTKGWSIQRASATMRGEPGTTVRLDVMRAGIPDTLKFTLKRARVHVNSVEGPMILGSAVGYLRLRTVSQSSAQELDSAISRLVDQGAEGLILDLRNNPGGVLEEGVALADLFLKPDDRVVETRGRAPGASRVYFARRPARWPNLPLVLLVNGGTASAAEILAGALQDHDRAAVLGTRTFGKGVAYVLIGLSETEAVSVTSSRWYTPSGRSIDRGRGGEFEEPLLGASEPEDTAATRNSHDDGGILPDLLVRVDTLTDGEQEFARFLGGMLPTYRDVLTAYALELNAEAPPESSGFEVSERMATEIRNRLREVGIEIPDPLWLQARGLVTRQFVYELSRYSFGRSEELRRIAMDDNQVRRAISLLRSAATSSEVVRRARAQSED